MENILNFLIKANKLKEMPRTGWILMEVKNPETVAEHIFGMAFTAWLLGKKRNLNIEKLIKITFTHDLCEVYAGDITPFFYYPRLPKGKEERKKMLLKWARLSKKEKKKISREKFKREKRALLKLLKPLHPSLKKEIFSLWLSYEKGFLKEGKFVRQINRIETLLQSIDYFGTKDVKTRTNWWEWTEEIVDDPLLLEFLEIIQNRFYGKTPGHRKNIELENILDFIWEIQKLKKMYRKYWLVSGIKNPGTVAGHIFSVVLMNWLLGSEKKKLNMEKLFKMALCHELSAVYTGDTIPYLQRLPKDKKKRKEILKKWPRLSKKEKMRRFLREYKEEKRALGKLTLKLDKRLKKEIVQCWDEYRKAKSPEALFLNQVNSLAVLLQGLQYQKKYKGYLAVPLWEWAFEKCDDPVTLEFMKELHRKFR